MAHLRAAAAAAGGVLGAAWWTDCRARRAHGAEAAAEVEVVGASGAVAAPAPLDRLVPRTTRSGPTLAHQQLLRAGYELRMVHVVTRHGLRTPIRSPRNVHGEWQCGGHATFSALLFGRGAHGGGGDDPEAAGADEADEAAEAFRHPWHPGAAPPAAVQQHVPAAALYRQKYIFSDAHTLPGDCYRGQLTMAGMVQMLEVGHMLRRLYVDAIPLLPPTLDPRLLYVRSSDSQRTVQSAQCVLEGMYHHAAHRDRAAPVARAVTIHTMDKALENMYGRSDCDRLAALKRRLRDSPEYKQFEEETAALRADVASALGYPRFPGWAAAHNTIECVRGNGLKVAGGLSRQQEQAVEEGASKEGALKFSDERIAMLSIGRFWRDVQLKMDAALASRTAARFFLFSAHDNTLSPLLGLLGVLDGHPPMASNLVIEVWESPAGAKFVHVMFNGESKTLPGCDGPVCSFDAFRARMNRFALSAEAYADACAVASDA